MKTFGIVIMLVASFISVGCRSTGADRWSGSAKQQQRAIAESPSSGEVYPNRD